MLRGCQMQRIGRLQSEAAAQVECAGEDGVVDGQPCLAGQQGFIGIDQVRLIEPHRFDQGFQSDQRRNTQGRVLVLFEPAQGGVRLRRCLFHPIDQQAAINISTAH